MPKVIIIAGNPLTGKTLSSLTFPKNLLHIDFDGNGLPNYKKILKPDGTLVLPSLEGITSIPMIKKEVPELVLKTGYLTKGKGVTPSYAFGAVELISQYNTIINSLAHDGTYNGLKFSTLVIDSLTEFFRLWRENLLVTNSQPSLAISDYGTMESLLFGQFFPRLKALPLDYVILTDHITAEKDELTGMITEMPVGTSKAQGKMLGKAVTELWRQVFTDGRAMWRTRPYGLFEAGSRSHVSDPCEANFEAVKSFLVQD